MLVKLHRFSFARWLTAIALAAGVAVAEHSTVRAQNDEGEAEPATGADAPAVGEEDGSLYSCAKGRKKSVWVNLKPETELKDLVGWAMTFTCKNFVYSSNIASARSGKVTIIAPKQMSPSQAWRLFLVSLQTMNLTVVPKGNILEIVETARAKEQPLPVYRPGAVASTDQIVRVILRPEHVSVDDLAGTLNVLKSKDGMITPFPNAGLVVVTDYGNHIKQMVRIMNEIDQPVSSESVYLLKVQYADAVELTQKLTEIFQQQAQPAAPKAAPKRPRRGKKAAQPAPAVNQAEVDAAVPSKMIADERTNVIILLASEPAYLRVSALVRYLDVQVEGGAGRIHVYYLENGDAEEMANVLNGVISGVQPAAGGGRARGGQPGGGAPAGGGGAAGAEAFEGQVRVTADKATNSLVIVASVKDFLSLRDVIRKLDTPRRQVFIEATIFEVSLDNSRRFGFSYHGGELFEALDDDALLLGGVQHGELSSLDLTSLLGQQGFLGGAIGPLLPGAEQLLGISVPSFGVLFQALASSNDVNVLSAPHIIATDNQEAEISVGQNIPYQGAFSGLGGLGGQQGGQGGVGGFGIPNVSVQREDVALTLKITPHINESDIVRLEIDQEISDIASENFNNLGPSWTKRKLKTTVVVRDQQSVVIGGLIQDKTLSTESKVPLLGDIPIFGHLFKYSRKTKTKTNLLIIITPYVIKDDMDVQRIVERKMRERREFLRTFTTFEDMEYKPDTDYRRKRGLVDEINRGVAKVEREAELLREYEQKEIIYPSGPVEYGTGEEPVEEEAPPDGDAPEATEPEEVEMEEPAE